LKLSAVPYCQGLPGSINARRCPVLIERNKGAPGRSCSCEGRIRYTGGGTPNHNKDDGQAGNRLTFGLSLRTELAGPIENTTETSSRNINSNTISLWHGRFSSIWHFHGSSLVGARTSLAPRRSISFIELLPTEVLVR